MFIFRKKQFVLIIFFLTLSFSFCLTQNLSNNERSYQATQVVAVPSSDKVIIIDAGHGGEDRWCS